MEQQPVALIPKWQPIETAPKDGTRILLWDGDLPVPALWDGRCWREALNEEYDLRTVTHWMPLPAPPHNAN